MTDEDFAILEKKMIQEMLYEIDKETISDFKNNVDDFFVARLNWEVHCPVEVDEVVEFVENFLAVQS